MIKITFKNVDQGDSILIEWTVNNENFIGIIDCALKIDKTNPVLEHLKKVTYQRIDFIILSHPHTDHFSGMFELIEYCRDNNILIKNFIHTCAQVHDYIKSSIKSTSGIKDITKIFSLIKDLRDTTGLNEGSISAPFFDYCLAPKISLSLLSPTSVEHDKYVKNESYLNGEEEGTNQPNANWISTIIKISIGNSYILLTSDAEKFSLIRIDKQILNDGKESLILGQGPHHGSKRNHNNSFWKKRKPLKNFIPVVFSVGKNHYGHVSKEVLLSFKKNNYTIYSTNEEGALKQNFSKESDYKSLRLDVFSLSMPNNNNSKLSGDQSFQFDDLGNIL